MRHALRLRRPAAVVAGLLTVGGAVVAPMPGLAHAGAPRFGLIDQTFNVPATGHIRMVLTLPIGVDPSPTGFVIRVDAHAPVVTRKEVADTIAGTLPDRTDTVELLPLGVPRPKPRQMVIDVPVEVGTDKPTALRLQDPGLHPVHVELVEGDTVTAELITFVNRVPTEDEDDDAAMPVAIAMTTSAPVTLGDDVAVDIDDDTRRELTALADLLDLAAVPVSVRVPPGQLTALANGTDEDRALAARLGTQLTEEETLSSPVLPLDVSLAADAGQDALYTQWLRDGEDALATVVDAPAQRTLAFADQPLSRKGGLLLRNLGTRMLVMPTTIYDALPGTLGGFTDTTQLVQVRVDENSTVDADVVDRTIAPKLARTTNDAELNAVQLVADLLAARQQVIDLGGDVARHSMLLGTPDLSLPSASGFGAFTDLLAHTPGLDPVTVDDLSARTDQLSGPDGPIVVDLPDDVDGDLGPRIDLRNALGLEAISTGSMLPPDDGRTADWARLIDALPTSALTDLQAGGIAADMRSEFQALRDAVVLSLPDGFSFRLTGTTGSVPVTLRNDADIPLTVRVRMTSSKLIVPEGDQTVELAPQAFTQVRIPVEARSNGESSATLEVFTPTGDVRLGPPVVVSATVTALTGVAYLLTGAALLVLLTWWVRHIRRNRRGRRAADAAERHPATRRADGDEDAETIDAAPDGAAAADAPSTATTGAAGAADDPDALSPDAATSTLPPS